MAVAIGARRGDRLDALTARLRDGGATVLQMVLDVTQEQACRDAVRRTREELGGPDVLVNNVDIARAVLYLVTQPPYVAVDEVLIRPTDQER